MTHRWAAFEAEFVKAHPTELTCTSHTDRQNYGVLGRDGRKYAAPHSALENVRNYLDERQYDITCGQTRERAPPLPDNVKLHHLNIGSEDRHHSLDVD